MRIRGDKLKRLSDQTGIGPMPHMIRKGRRMSAAKAFLDPVRRRPNLAILTGLQGHKVLFEGNVMELTGPLTLAEEVARALRRSRSQAAPMRVTIS